MPQVALAYLLARSPVMLAIPGTGSVEHLEENMAASRIDLTVGRHGGAGSAALTDRR